MRTLVYKSDKGCRKGCHRVFILRVYRGKIEEDYYFAVDEIRAAFADACKRNGWEPSEKNFQAYLDGLRLMRFTNL